MCGHTHIFLLRIQSPQMANNQDDQQKTTSSDVFASFFAMLFIGALGVGIISFGLGPLAPSGKGGYLDLDGMFSVASTVAVFAGAIVILCGVFAFIQTLTKKMSGK